MSQTVPKKRKQAGLMIFFYTLAILFTVSFTSIARSAPKPEVTDTTITDAVEDELLMDVAVQSSGIDVTTKDGVVFLKGKIDNLLSKERAANIARTVKGVRSVVNDLEVNPPLNIEDWQIKDEVDDALQFDPVASHFKINVSVKDSVVTLTGTVATWKERNICEKVAEGVKGVKNIIDLIEINWTKGNEFDAGIKKEIERLLEWDSSIDNGLINVSVDHGKVYLKGSVGSAIEKMNATLDSYVDGVKEVDNSGLEVVKWQREDAMRGKKYFHKLDSDIAQAVKDALKTEPRVSSFKIDVEVVPGTYEIKLRGTVNNLKAKNTATLKARKIVGVRSVVNRIKVRPEQNISDQRIKEGVRKALGRDPYLISYVIEVDVSNGVVKLYGDVDTAFEKSHAEDIASGINGVVKVDNLLVIRNFSNTYTYDPWVNDTYLYDYYWYQNMPLHATKSDSEILKDIKNELFWSPFVNADQVKVKVDEGVATLTGNVNSWLEHDAAMRCAYKGGATYVKNNLTVKK